jgi:hypothetical protein
MDAAEKIGINLKSLKQAVRRIQKRAMSPILQRAKAKAPVLSGVAYRRGKIYRIPGVVRDAISIRPSKRDAKRDSIGTFVNVKPLPGNKYRKVGEKIVPTKDGGSRLVGDYILTKKGLRTNRKEGYNNPRDPYYWQWLELGWKNGQRPAKKFLANQKSLLPKAEDEMRNGINEYFARKRK